MRILKQLLLIVMAAWAILSPAPEAIAQSSGFQPQESSYSAYQRVLPNFNDISFSTLGEVENGGSFSGAGESRTFSEGDPVSSVIDLGDISSLNGQAFSLTQIDAITGTNGAERVLTNFELLGRQDLGTLSSQVPLINDFDVADIEPIDQLLTEQIGADTFSGRSLAQVLESNPGLTDVPLNATDLSNFSVGDIPNADLVPLQNFDGWETSTISEVPGLAGVPLSQFPTGITGLSGIISRIDFAWSTAESNRTNTISGSYQEGFEVPCPQDGQLTGFESPYEAEEANDPVECAYIELDDLEDEGRAVQGDFEGKQWISGKYHEVEGGFGPLKYVPSPMGYSVGYEPTGRHPFGEAFKVVVWEPYEVTDEISFRIFFRFCTYIFGERTCTPYNQVALPWFTYNVNSLLFVGSLDGAGGSTAAPAPPPGTPANPLQSPTLGPCPTAGSTSGETVGGIDIGRLAGAIAAIESRGSGNYEAVGVFSDTGRNQGRGLGRYQLMSYLPEVKREVSNVEGGQQWLNGIERGYKPSRAEVQRYFPADAQERAYQSEVNQLVDRARNTTDPTTGQPFEGDRLIERVGQTWIGGPGAPIDGSSSDALGTSVYEYGVRARENYRVRTSGGSTSTSPQNCVPAAGGSGPGGSVLDGEAGAPGVATGNFANPTPGYRLTSDFGQRPPPCAGCSSFHPAVDLGTPTGTPVGAADGGEVVYVAPEGQNGGYGTTVVVDHGNGYQTRYSHLQASNVSVGDPVGRGQQIATSGSTGAGTGPHLDFGVYENSGTPFPPKTTAVDPEGFINF